MKKPKFLIYLIITLSFSMIIWGCKTSRNAQEQLEEGSFIQGIIEAGAKYIGLNLTKDSQYKGINKVSFEGSQAFDFNWWGFDGSLSMFSENGNKTLSILGTMTSPEPTNSTSYQTSHPEMNPTSILFADGTHADNYAMTGTMRPVPVTVRRRVDYNGDDNALQQPGLTSTNWAVEYDSTSGYPTSYTNTIHDSGPDTAATGTNIRTVYTFAKDTVQSSINNYFKNSYIKYDYDGTNFTRTQKWTKTKTGTYSSVKSFDITETESCYGADDDTPATDCGLGNSAAQKVFNQVFSGTTLTQTKRYFNTAGAETHQGVSVVEYENADRQHISSIITSEYDVGSAGTHTLTVKSDSTWANGFKVSNRSYTVASGEATLSSTETRTKDAQGRNTDYLLTASDGNPTKHLVYTFDSSGTIATQREYGYTGTTQNTTPECAAGWNYNFDWSYARDASGVVTKTLINYCNSDIYYDNGYSKRVDIRNSMGRQTSTKVYLYNGTTTTTLSEQFNYEYDTNENQTKEQRYTVDSAGTPTAGEYSIMSYDSNLFKVLTKYYDKDGNLLLNGFGNALCSTTTTATCYYEISYTYR